MNIETHYTDIIAKAAREHYRFQSNTIFDVLLTFENAAATVNKQYGKDIEHKLRQTLLREKEERGIQQPDIT